MATMSKPIENLRNFSAVEKYNSDEALKIEINVVEEIEETCKNNDLTSISEEIQSMFERRMKGSYQKLELWCCEIL